MTTTAEVTLYVAWVVIGFIIAMTGARRIQPGHPSYWIMLIGNFGLPMLFTDFAPIVVASGIILFLTISGVYFGKSQGAIAGIVGGSFWGIVVWWVIMFVGLAFSHFIRTGNATYGWWLYPIFFGVFCPNLGFTMSKIKGH